MIHDLEIAGALVVSPDGERPRTIAVHDGRIAALLDRPTGRARRTVDATGLVALPGLVDEHLHFMDPGDTTREDFQHGSAAALVGGVTTVVEHTHAHPVLDAAGLRAKTAHVAGRARVDHLLAAHVFPESIEAIPALAAAGIGMLKAFTCTTHGIPGLAPDDLLRALRLAARSGLRVLVHCEDESITAAAERRLRAALRTDFGVVPEWRSAEAELVAVGTVALLARLTGARVTIAHVSQPAALELIARERAAGARLDAETCPQYLLLDEADVRAHGPTRKFTPPARPAPAADGLWEAVTSGAVALLASDHAPSTLAQKGAGDIWECPFGLPGVETTLPLMADAVAGGRLSWSRLAEIASAAPARALGLAGVKGGLAPGHDADVALVDPVARHVLRDADVVSRAGWTPYAGRALTGRVVMTFLRGTLAAQDGRAVAEPGFGRSPFPPSGNPYHRMGPQGP